MGFLNVKYVKFVKDQLEAWLTFLQSTYNNVVLSVIWWNYDL